MPNQILTKYRYLWPLSDLSGITQWNVTADNRFFERTMPEGDQELAMDSRWPSIYPSPMCLVTTSHGSKVALEKSVGASIVNRFPYVLALSFCKQNLSERHYARTVFSKMIEESGSVTVQFLPPGHALDKALNAISTLPEAHIHKRIDHTGLAVRKALTNDAPVFTDAYMVYEASLVKPGKDFEDLPIYQHSWVDVGSHRVYFLEINAVQLREDIAKGNSQIHWRSLPAWKPLLRKQGYLTTDDSIIQKETYQKGYTAHYRFPSSSTTAFEADSIQDDMHIKYLPPLPEDQVEVDNDRARWPCFFPASLSLITAWAEDGIPNMMPCGSTMVVSRHPLTIAPCISYAAINERYSPRATLNIIRRTGTFGCGVPFIHKNIINAIQYTGNISLTEDTKKVQHAGLEWESTKYAPILSALPVHFECRVVDEIRLGTHCMFLGEVRRIRIRTDVTPDNALEWFPWADVKRTDD